CVNMAIAMQRRMRELQSEWLEMGLERPFELRIGINTGFCTVGNFGSAERMDYTIIGNEVNLAARLEALAEVGGILLAHETPALVKDTVLAEEGDTLTVKGFAKPVRTYSVVGLYEDLAEQGRIIRREQDGVRVLVELKKGDKADAKACVNMAIAMQRRMRELRSEWLDLGLERPFELRIGINTGFCTVGNFGSADRMDYTIIGNEVNLAARLESLAEVGGILMAHETHSLVKDTVMAEEGDTLTVKGLAKPVRTYSVVGLYDDLAEQGRIIRKEQDGLHILLDLDKQDKVSAIEAVEDVLSQLKG
ncbi:MAG: adenylate/guanylate cyclase domain-containing protein, partial [Kiloniellales bacterium]